MADLVQSGSFVTIEAEKPKHKFFEVLGEAGAIDLLEVEVGLSSEDQVVEVLFGARLLERENALHNDEQNDGEREQIYLAALVLFALLDLGSHVRHCSAVALEGIDVLVAGEAEVGKLEVHVLIEEDVLELQVAVDHALAVQVLKSIKHLVREEAACILAHGTHQLAEVEKKSTIDVLHDDVDQVINDTGRWLDNGTLVTELEHVDNALMLYVLKYLDLVVD